MRYFNNIIFLIITLLFSYLENKKGFKIFITTDQILNWKVIFKIKFCKLSFMQNTRIFSPINYVVIDRAVDKYVRLKKL